jgi:hypothetical protein
MQIMAADNGCNILAKLSLYLYEEQRKAPLKVLPILLRRE